MIYTNFKFDTCLNFDLEFLELLKGVIARGIRQDLEAHPYPPWPTYYYQQKIASILYFMVFARFYSTTSILIEVDFQQNAL